MKPKIRRQFKQGKREIIERLKPFMGGTEPRQEGRPEFSGPRPTYETQIKRYPRRNGRDASGGHADDSQATPVPSG